MFRLLGCSFLATAMAMLFATTLRAESGEEAKAEVRRLVLQLNSDLLDQRDAAEQQLLKQGADILPLLPTVKPTMPAEVQQRLRRVRVALEAEAAEAATQGARVSLQGKLKLSAAIARLQEQSGNELVDYRAMLQQPTSDPELDFDLQEVPFWQALDEVLNQSGLVLLGYADLDSPGIAFAAPTYERPKQQWVAYEGPFRMSLTRMSAVRDLTDADGGRLQATVQIQCEPRLKPIVMSLPMNSLQATTSDGKTIAAAIGGVRPITIISQETSVEIPLELPPRGAEQLSTLSGHFTALVPGRQETFRFADLPIEKPQEQRKAGAIVALEKTRKNNDVWEVRIRVRFDEPSGALESHLMGWVLENKAYLEDSKGNQIERGALEKTREVADEFGVAYLFFPEGEISEYTFVYQTPAALINREIKFEFKDVPLP